MAQRNILENSVNMLNQLRGPAKILYSSVPAASLPMPIMIHQVIDPTGGAAATGWTSLGFTRGGINVTKRLDKQVYDDLDQIIGEWGQRTTNRGYRITTQLAEVLDRAQMGLVMEPGTATQVSTASPTQVMQPLDAGSNQAVARRVAVVFPKDTEGKVFAFVFRNVEPAGGDRTWRFDKSDPVSPGLELIAFPEIATTIPSEDAYGRSFDII
jgi:hypothetical protein